MVLVLNIIIYSTNEYALVILMMELDIVYHYIVRPLLSAALGRTKFWFT